MLTGCWDRHDCPCSIAPSVVSLSPSSLWALTGTSRTKTTEAKDCAPSQPLQAVGRPLSFHCAWSSTRVTAQVFSLEQLLQHKQIPQADQGCSKYFSSFLDSSTSGVFLGHEGVLQALQRMRKRMRMRNAMTQLKEIATIAPVERAAAMATVLQELAGPTAWSHAWDARAVIERAASTCWHWQGTKGTAVVLAVGWGWGQAGSRTVSPCQFGHSQLCPGLHHTTREAFSGFPLLRQGREDTGITVLPPAPGREKITVSMKGQAVRAPQVGLWGCQATPTPWFTRLCRSSKVATRSDAVLGTFPSPFSSPGSTPHPPRGPPS